MIGRVSERNDITHSVAAKEGHAAQFYPAAKHFAGLSADIFDVKFHPRHIRIDPGTGVYIGENITGSERLSRGHAEGDIARDVVRWNDDLRFVETLFAGCVHRHNLYERIVSINGETNIWNRPLVGFLGPRERGNGLKRSGPISHGGEHDFVRDNAEIGRAHV